MNEHERDRQITECKNEERSANMEATSKDSRDDTPDEDHWNA